MINKVHERALEVLLNDHKSDFETLLQNNNEEGLAISEIPVENFYSYYLSQFIFSQYFR